MGVEEKGWGPQGPESYLKKPSFFCFIRIPDREMKAAELKKVLKKKKNAANCPNLEKTWTDRLKKLSNL